MTVPSDSRRLSDRDLYVHPIAVRGKLFAVFWKPSSNCDVAGGKHTATEEISVVTIVTTSKHCPELEIKLTMS